MNTELQTKSQNSQQNVDKSKKNKGSIKEFIAKLSRGLMLPIAMLPIAGLFLGVGSAIVNNTEGVAQVIGNILLMPGQIVFNSLPVLFAIAIAITFTKDSGTAGLSAFVGWIVFCAFQCALIQYNRIDPSLGNSAENLSSIDFLFYHWDVNGVATSNGYMMFNSIFTDNVGIKSLSTSVFGGMAVGFSVAWLYNKFKNIQLPAIIGFFSGIRFIPIATFGFSIILSLFFCMVWPLIGQGIYYLGLGLMSIPFGLNSFLFGVIERCLVPFGLHHAFYTPLWYTTAGGSFNLDSYAVIMMNGNYYCVVAEGTSNFLKWSDASLSAKGGIIQGDQTIWMEMSKLAGKEVSVIQINSSYDGGTPIAMGSSFKTTLTFDSISQGTRWANSGILQNNPGQYMQGKYAIMMLALPAAALAMITAAPKENQKMAASIIVSAALASFITGITEPLEYTFLFLAPWMFWGFHAIFCGVSFWLMNLFGAHMGMTFSGGIIDFCIYGVLPDTLGAGANCWWAIIIGLLLTPIYYFGFYFAIKKFNIATPGRGGNEKLFTKTDYQKKESIKQNKIDVKLSEMTPTRLKTIEIIKAYGGLDNLKNVDACITKLRIQVNDIDKVNRDRLMELGARGTIKPSPQSIYAVFGAEADRIKNEMNQVFEDIKNNPSFEKEYFK